VEDTKLKLTLRLNACLSVSVIRSVNLLLLFHLLFYFLLVLIKNKEKGKEGIYRPALMVAQGCCPPGGVAGSSSSSGATVPPPPSDSVRSYKRSPDDRAISLWWQQFFVIWWWIIDVFCGPFHSGPHRYDSNLDKFANSFCPLESDSC
jgi:hypothetical protein